MRPFSKRLFVFSVPTAGLVSGVACAVEAYPVPKSGFCHRGYHQSGNYCVPSNQGSEL
jgi:hypothetical protein